MSRPRAALWMPIAYAAASMLLWLAGRLWATRILDAMPILLYAGAQWVLGPLAFAFNLGAGIPGGDLTVIWAFFFLLATVLLPLCLHLIGRPSPWIRTGGVVMAVAIWIASGFLNFLGMLQGL